MDFGEAEIEPDPEQPDVQRKRDSGYSYNQPSRSYPRLRFQANQPRDQIASRDPSQLNKPFSTYGPPNHPTSTSGYRVQQQHRNKLQHHVSQQQSISYDVGLTQQEAPSPIRNTGFADANSIASQNNEPFGMHTANYLPPQNQKLPAYSSADNFAPQSSSPPSSSGPVQSTSHNLMQPQNQQISDAALFLSQNAQAIQQLYGAPASSQNFAPSYDQLQAAGGQIQNGQFGNLQSTSPSPQEFPSALPPYASGTLNSQETLEQIQSLEKDRLIVQLQQALAQAQSGSSAEAGRYAQNQASFIQNQELLASISQQTKSHVSTTPQAVALAALGGNTAFSQSPFLPGTTVNPLGFPLSYGVPTTAQTPATTTTTATAVAPPRPPQSSGGDSTSQVTSSLPAPNQPGSSATGSPVGIPVYGGFAPTFIAGANFVPSYSTSVFTSGRPAVQPSGSSPTHFGIPIPTESSQKPTSATPVSPGRPAVALTPAITPVVLPVQPIRPVAATPLRPLATHPIVSPLHPVLPPASPAQVQPGLQATPVVTSSGVQYGLHSTALINPVLYKPVKAVYPVYYYSDVAYQLQKPAVPSHPWSYAPSYAQAKPAQIWKWGVPVHRDHGSWVAARYSGWLVYPRGKERGRDWRRKYDERGESPIAESRDFDVLMTLRRIAY